MRTRWAVQTRDADQWHDHPTPDQQLSTNHRAWRDLVNAGQRARLLLNGRPIRMTSTSEQLDLDNELE